MLIRLPGYWFYFMHMLQIHFRKWGSAFIIVGEPGLVLSLRGEGQRRPPQKGSVRYILLCLSHPVHQFLDLFHTIYSPANGLGRRVHMFLIQNFSDFQTKFFIPHFKHHSLQTNCKQIGYSYQELQGG